MDEQFRSYCLKWSEDIASISDEDGRVAYFQEHLPELLLDRDTVGAVIERMANGRPWPDLKKAELFRHEVLLYLDPSRRFSIRLYFHPARTHTPIHDHTSWGVSGSPGGRLSVTGWTCNGDPAEGHVKLHRKYQKMLRPGEVDLTRAWMDGLHQTGSGDDALNVMISAYGRPGRRLYVNLFDAETGRVERRYPLRLQQRLLAKEALQLYSRNNL